MHNRCMAMEAHGEEALTAMIVLVLLFGFAAAIIISVAPFCLPWRQRLRWLIATSTVPDPWSLGSMAWPGLEEFTVKTVSPLEGGLLVVGPCGPAGVPTSLWLDCVTNQDAELLESSAAAGVPLLLIVGPDGAVALHGPTWSVAGLQVLEEPYGAIGPHQPVNAPQGL
jgi:hypothetical protein